MEYEKMEDVRIRCRCRDCMYSKVVATRPPVTKNIASNMYLLCCVWDNDIGAVVNPYDFCSYAEPKKE